MQFRKWGLMVLGLFLTFAGGNAALAAGPIEVSGHTFNVAVCARSNGPGVARCFAHVKTDSRGNIFDGKPNTLSPHVVPSGYGPTDLRRAYAVSGSGATVTIAIVDAYGYPNAEADLAVYRNTYGLPACTTANGCFKKVNQNGVQGSYPRADTGWSQETALDLDMASAMCQTCKILLVQGNTSSLVNLGTAVNTAVSLGAHVVSNSYGGGESGTASYDSYYNHPGVAITVSSGDSGYGVQFPAASEYVTAVGGTSLVRDTTTRGFHETVWNGAGSGCSGVYAKPTWQKDTGCARRTVADVSAIADPNTGVAVYGPTSRSSSGWQVYGGTSVAAPLIGGIYAANGGPVTNGSDPYSHTAALFDVPSGSNGSCGGTYLCTGGTGYDGPTGLGTPNGLTAF